MKYYIDESGDLGFSEGSSRYFVIAVLKHDNLQELNDLLSGVRKRIHNKVMGRQPELKAHDVPEKIRRIVMEGIAGLDAEIFSIIVNKASIHHDRQVRSEKLYNYLMGVICTEQAILQDGGNAESGNGDSGRGDILGEGNESRGMEIILDRRYRSQRKENDFTYHLFRSFSRESPLQDTSTAEVPEITSLDSASSAGLQLADFVAWAIFQKYEHQNLEYYDLIRNLITLEKRFFP